MAKSISHDRDGKKISTGRGKYGTSGGIELTDELIERLAQEAEEGYDVERLRPSTESQDSFKENRGR